MNTGTAQRRNPPVRRQQGFSLVIVLIIMVIVSLLGVAATQTSLLSERTTRYDRDYQIAFQSAEAALLDAEFDIRGPNTSASSRVAAFGAGSVLGFTDGCGSGVDRGLCLPTSSPTKPVWYTVDFNDTTANAQTVAFGDFTDRSLGYGGSGPRPARAPRYIIEAIPDTTPGTAAGNANILYRVTSIGYGPRVETQAVVQMVFRKE